MADCKRKTELLNDNPLCGINTYKDTLNLATGTCTRQIKKLVFDGTEEWQNYGQVPNTYRLSISNTQSIGNPAICSHFVNSPISEITSGKFTVGSTWIYVRYADVSDLADFKSYLQQQYTNGTPVTIWYVLAETTTETITVPSGLSGTEEGYLNQSSTPTPTNPIYPTANNVEVWLHSLRKLTTATDTITTLPSDVYADGTNATVGLVGNMQQSGTPTPSSPITPSECGERTENLFDGELKQGSVAESSSVGTGYDDVTDYQSTKRVVTSNPVVCHGATVTWDNSKYWICICYFDKNLGYIGNTSQGFETWITTGVHEMHKYPYAAIAVRRTDNADFTPEDASDLNLVVDTYKIPISSANTTTPVYLGEVETTRKIKKVVLTGSETELYFNSTNKTFFFKLTGGLYSGTVRTTPLICSHFLHLEDGRPFSEIPNNSIYIATLDSSAAAYIYSTDYADLASFKTYLAQQYANGTPVTVWYVLATPQTAVVNEPIRKIGDYADTVSGITIPTITGKDTFDVLTTLKPSEVSLAYTGWHDAEVEEWDGSQWQ